jgi:hypothetical protein
VRTPMTKSTRQVLAEMRAERRQRREACNAELDRRDREVAERLANLQPIPLFSEAAVEGKCPECHGSQFRPLARTGAAAVGGFLAAGLIGSIVAASVDQGYVECVTCGKVFRKG